MPKKLDIYKELLGFKKMQKVAKERLHPPMAPIASEKSVLKSGDKDSDLPKSVKLTDTDSKLAIDYHRIADLATFERFMIEAIKIIVPGFQGVHTRVSKSKMTKEFNQRIVNYGSVVKEYEVKLAKIKEKSENKKKD